ncbi:hypothetical protein FB45DRAFT_1058143 [Roridomyces roridus]|uniref:F-box domain-containing protein n=1 Tax=Roridomyces roridus TaxID=1738132 RepID=A0AAD7BXI9_9AGAR|nr:hypothetical protein FB45DRAFT_1058143 [Roridomyces roridus]
MASSALAATRARIAQLDIEIQKLQRLMDPLLAEREQCTQTVADFRIKYPVLTLPAEITSEIFLHFLPSYPRRPTIIGPQSPSLLLQICRQWRDVALATPSLWSTVELYLDYAGYHAHKRDLFKKWLQRSGNCVLSIRLEYDMDDEERVAISGECVEALLCHASRWQDLEIIWPFEGLRNIAGSMPLLRSVTVGPCEWGERPETPVVLFTEAPALRNAVLPNFFDPFAIILPWSQITTLFADALRLDEAIEILRQSTTLEHCTITTIYDGDASAASLIPPLPVRSLTLRFSASSTAARLLHLFAALNLPLLETLAVNEFFLGPDPVGTLSGLCPNRYPQEIEIFHARTPREIYAGAFPLASLSVHELSV